MKYYFLLLISMVLFSCEKRPEPIEVFQEPSWVIVNTLATGKFVDTDAHKLNGKVYVYRDVKGRDILSFEEFSVLGGPDVDVYISDSNTYTKNAILCGHLPGVDGQPVSGSLTFPISTGDLATHHYVILWCKKYAVLFGYADLKLSGASKGD